jgi:hypothetical protein
MSIDNINNGLANNAQLDNQRTTQQHEAPIASKTTAKTVAQNSISLTPYVQNSHKCHNEVLEAPVNKAKLINYGLPFQMVNTVLFQKT